MDKIVKIVACILFSVWVCAFSSMLLWGWRVCSPFCVNHPGVVLVALGVIGETIWEEHKKLKRYFGWILIAGLLLEMREAIKQDGAVMTLQSRVEELRKQNDELEAKAQWRTITHAQETNLVAILLPFAQLNILAIKEVHIGAHQSTDFEAMRYVKRITVVLRQCGFNAKMDAPGIAFGDPEKMADSPTGLTITQNGYNPNDNLIAIINAFEMTGIKITQLTMITNLPPDGIVNIKVWPKPE